MNIHESIDWGPIKSEALRALETSWSPYSHFAVGAAGLLQDGRIVSGANIENASYGVTLCAECSMTSANIAGGRSLYRAIVVFGRGAMPIGGDAIEAANEPFIVGPCGRCRQLLAEHSDEQTEMLSNFGPKRLLGDIFPYTNDF